MQELTALVIEDDESIAMIMLDILNDMGVKVLHAVNVDEALMLDKEPHDIVICDYQLGKDENGFEFMAKRESTTESYLHSSYDFEEDVVAKYGYVEAIPKLIGIMPLIESVKQRNQVWKSW